MFTNSTYMGNCEIGDSGCPTYVLCFYDDAEA